MPVETVTMASELTASLLISLRDASARVKALAQTEAEQLASSIARIAALLSSGQIDTDEAAMLLRIQRDASEAVLASLAELSRVEANRAVTIGLQRLAATAGGAIAGLLNSI